ncbi:MAG: DUF211 domain-containing protein [Gammaproteobacteria bacterium]|jgi:hypothetical protein
MTLLTRIVLDVLKPHVPNALEFAKAIADNNAGCQVTVTVVEVDEKTESTMVTIEGNEIEYEQVVDAVTSLGASVHSIDEVTVSNKTQSTD